MVKVLHWNRTRCPGFAELKAVHRKATKSAIITGLRALA